MNPWTTLAAVLQQLPPSLRRTLYTIVTSAGAVLAIAQIAGWRSIGPVDLDSALKVYALVSSPTGFLALANVRPRRDGADEPDDGDDGYPGYAGYGEGAEDDLYASAPDEASFS